MMTQIFLAWFCQISGSGKTLKVRTLGCARSSLPTDLRPSSLRSRGRTRRTRNTERHEIYTGSGHRCGVIPYSSVWWIASWADDEQYKGKNSLLRLRRSCACRPCVGEDSMPLLWWLVYLYRPWSSSQILSRKGANNGGKFEGGQLVQAILTKVVFACERLKW